MVFVLEGNPAGSKLTGMMLDRQEAIYGRYPLKAANLEKVKGKGVKDVCFSKGRGLEEEDMYRSKQVYKGLRKFRAGY